MTSPLKKLFGDTPEVRVWEAIIPLAVTERVYVDDVIRVTGLHRDQVSKLLDQVLITHGGYMMDRDDRPYFKLDNSNLAAHINNLIHMIYSDNLLRSQKDRMAKVQK